TFRPAVTGTLSLAAPEGWTVAPAGQAFQLAAVGGQTRLRFMVTAPAGSATASLAASAETGGVTFGNQRVEIHYAHLAPLLLQPAARCKAVSLDLSIRGRNVGYVPGAGDNVADALTEMGYVVSPLQSADLTPDRLRGLDAVVIGIRAFNVRKDLAAHLPVLFAYVEAGGNLIVQYNNPNGLKETALAPYALQLSGERVTDETAPMT